MAFNGSLLKSGGVEFPLDLIFTDSYVIAPHRRQDLDSGRNANGVLNRNVLDHTATTIKFDTKPMYQYDVKRLFDWLDNAYGSEANKHEKKLSLTYYSPDTDSYWTANFYVPDIELKIYMIDTDKKKILYNSFTVEFIQY